MAGCPAYGSSSGVSIYYAVDADPDAAIADTLVWNEVPFTSDSLAGNLTSSQSERITAARAYAGSAITAGEVSGSLGFESEANVFMNTMLQAVLQSPTPPLSGSPGNAYYVEGQLANTVVASVSAPAGFTAVDFRFKTGTSSTSSDTFFFVSSSGQISITSAGAIGAANTFSDSGSDSRTYVLQALDSEGTPSADITIVLHVVETVADIPASAAMNGATPMCLMFLKRITRGTGYDYYVFRGVQVDSMSLNISPGSFITGELALQGIRMGAGALGAEGTANDVLTTIPVGWTLTPYTSGSIMSSVFAIQDLEVQDSAGDDIGVIARELSLTLSNQLRQQQAIGTGTPFAAGIASGRFMVTASLEAYYSGPDIVNAMFRDQELKLTFDLVDPDGKGWTFLMDKCKITSSPPPMAEGPDQDLMATTDIQGFESATNGSIKVTRLGNWT